MQVGKITDLTDTGTLPQLTLCEPIVRATASALGAHHQPHQGHAADQRVPLQSVCLGLLVLQQSRMLDTVSDEKTGFCTPRAQARLHLKRMASGKAARSRAGADAANAEHSVQTGLELREPSWVQAFTDTRSDATSSRDHSMWLLPQRIAVGCRHASAIVTGLQLLQDNWIDLTDIALENNPSGSVHNIISGAL